MRDFLVIGGGSAGSVLAAELARRQAGTVMVLEAGPSEVHPFVAVPMGLVWLMGGARDWAFKTTAQRNSAGRNVSVPRGRMIGGSGSINSMVWFRGRQSDFDDWNVPGWGWDDVRPAFEAVEAQLTPNRMRTSHPLTEAIEGLFAATTPSPEVESAGVCHHNMRNGRRMSAARGFLRQAPAVEVRTNSQVDCLIWDGDRAAGVRLVDGAEIKAAKGVVLSAGSVASPAILMRSGVGPADDLKGLGIDVRLDQPEVGQNLHDHPAVGLHFEGAGTGYGLEPKQWPLWGAAPVSYGFARRGPFASPTVEGAMFFNARGDGDTPDVQSHFIPFFLPHQGTLYQRKAGYFVDACVCRPKSRGAFRLASADPKAAPLIDLGLFNDSSDLDTLAAGVERLRGLLDQVDFGKRRGAEVHPGPRVKGDALKDHIRKSAGTAYHPVGTLRMGEGSAPVGPTLDVKGVDGLWVADASVMPAVTSANTNAPSMMIGWKGAQFISERVA